MSDAKKATNQAKWAEKMDKDWVGNPLAYPVSFGCATLVELEHVYALVCLQIPPGSCWMEEISTRDLQDPTILHTQDETLPGQPVSGFAL